MTTLGRLIFSIFSFATLIIFFIFLRIISVGNAAQKITYVPIATLKPTSIPTIKPISLEGVVKNALEGSKGTYSLSIKNLKTGEKFNQDEHKLYQAGSLYKLWLLGPIYNLLNANKMALSDVLSDNVGNLNRKFGVESDLSELPEDQDIAMTVNDAITQMITISHNYAAMLLLDKVGRPAINSYISSLGLKDSGLQDLPYTTSYDTSLFFEKLYKGEIIDKISSDKMLEILKKQTFNDGLPKLLPKNVEIAHKTGDIDLFKHDCGIVFSPKSDYIICILSESDFPSGAQERISQISKAVFDYFQQTD